VDFLSLFYNESFFLVPVGRSGQSPSADALQYVADTWGDTFPSDCADWDLIIASDILLCEFTDLQQFLSSMILLTLLDFLNGQSESKCVVCYDYHFTAVDSKFLNDRDVYVDFYFC